ncbi:MAG: hypothetical protein M1376_18585 [Planctomycetes bacterium]|nr:hypothetical protein [Planctomycetota bacterium]
MIIAGSIVGSGELILTTKTGAEAGFWLLWLITIGCVIKVSTQIEFARHTITWGNTPLQALNAVRCEICPARVCGSTGYCGTGPS